MNIYIGQNTRNEHLYRPNTQEMNQMNVYIGQNTKNEHLYWPNTKNERLYRPKHKK